MSHTPCISHRMFVAAVSLESPEALEHTANSDVGDEETSATLEVLDLPGWSGATLHGEPAPSFNARADGF